MTKKNIIDLLKKYGGSKNITRVLVNDAFVLPRRCYFIFDFEIECMLIIDRSKNTIGPVYDQRRERNRKPGPEMYTVDFENVKAIMFAITEEQFKKYEDLYNNSETSVEVLEDGSNCPMKPEIPEG